MEDIFEAIAEMAKVIVEAITKMIEAIAEVITNKRSYNLKDANKKVPCHQTFKRLNNNLRNRINAINYGRR